MISTFILFVSLAKFKKHLLYCGKMRNLCSETKDYMFSGYLEHSVVYWLCVLKNDVLDCNTIIDTRNDELFEHIFFTG